MKNVGAFVTVEYTLLFPVLCVIYTFLIYIGIYQYNECLLQNDVYFCAMEEARLTYANKYMLVEEVGIELNQKGNRLIIAGESKMSTPLHTLGILEKYWCFEQNLEVQKHSPQNILRICKDFSYE